MALFESSLGFTWEMANYRQVLSGAKRLRHPSLTLYQAQAHSCVAFVKKMFAFSCCLSPRRIYNTVKPDSQECQAWTKARPTNDAQGWMWSTLSHTATSACMLIFPSDVRQFISSDFTPDASLTLNDRSVEPTNITVVLRWLAKSLMDRCADF